jgi:hypothetical protein
MRSNPAGRAAGYEKEESSKKRWLERHGLSFTGTEGAWEFISVLSPALSTVLFDLF